MSDKLQQFRPALDALEGELTDLKRKSNEIKAAINTLCRNAGVSPHYSDEEIAGSNQDQAFLEIKPDTFYGKKMSRAAREYLEMRRARGQGPAKPREVYDALVEGGLQFTGKDMNLRLTVLRSAMRKNSQTFHRLPNGSYGLLKWYPDAKPSKDNGLGYTQEDEEDISENSDETQGESSSGEQKVGATDNVAPTP